MDDDSTTPIPEWEKLLDDRQRAEIAFAKMYTKNFKHGTDGHHRLTIIARLSDLLDDAYTRLGTNDHADAAPPTE